MTTFEKLSNLGGGRIDGEWFYNHIGDLKDLHYHAWDNEIDHTWHEFDCIEFTEEAATKGDVVELLERVEAVDRYYVGCGCGSKI